jgi:hypothetical protein
MVGNASTTMLVFSSLSGAPLPDPLEQPAASITIAVAHAVRRFRDFMPAPTDFAEVVNYLRQFWKRATVIIGFGIVRHRPNGMKRYELPDWALSVITAYPLCAFKAAVDASVWFDSEG